MSNLNKIPPSLPQKEREKTTMLSYKINLEKYKHSRQSRQLRVCLVGDQNLPRLTFGKLWLPEKVWRAKLKSHL
jgi:hypothetical protein